MFYNNEPSGLYYKNIMIVNDTSRVIRIMLQLRASLVIIPMTRGVINAPRVINYAPKEHL
jgi:hypothetical protein